MTTTTSTATTTTTTTTPLSTTATLELRIESLNQAIKHVQLLRQIPPHLLRLPLRKPSASGIASAQGWLPNNTIQHYRNFKSIFDQVCSEPVQQALIAARESEQLDSTDITVNARRENRRRRRPPSPSSPQPYISPNINSTSNKSMFPPHSDNDPDPLRIEHLTSFAKDFNHSHSSKLHIWLRSRGTPKDDRPIVVRFTVPDVLTAYIAWNYLPHDSTLLVESISVFSPREQTTPQSQSEFAIYQTLSQQISKMIQSYPSVSFQRLLSLLCSYDDLFISRCTKCDRVLSAEGHVPPVARVWVESQDETQSGKWEPRHVGCQQT